MPARNVSATPNGPNANHEENDVDSVDSEVSAASTAQVNYYSLKLAAFFFSGRAGEWGHKCQMELVENLGMIVYKSIRPYKYIVAR